MANPYFNRRRRIAGAAANYGAGAVGYMAARGRAPSFDVEGNVRGFRGRPGATPSDRETMGSAGLNREFGTGMTPDNAWNASFPSRPSGGSRTPAPAPIIPAPDMTDVPGNPSAFDPQQFGLAPDVPQDAMAMAADLGDFQYQGDVPPVDEMSADDYLNATLDENERWFSGRGASRGIAATGYPERLKRLAESGFEDLA